MLSRLVITFLSRSTCLLISWLQSPSAVIVEPPKNKVSHCFHCFSIYLPWSDGTREWTWWSLIGYILGVEFSSVWFALSTLLCWGPPDSSPCHLCTCVRRLHLHLISYQDRKNTLPLPVVVHSPGDGEHRSVRGGCSFFFLIHIFSLPSVTEIMSCKAGIC